MKKLIVFFLIAILAIIGIMSVILNVQEKNFQAHLIDREKAWARAFKIEVEAAKEDICNNRQ